MSAAQRDPNELKSDIAAHIRNGEARDALRIAQESIILYPTDANLLLMGALAALLAGQPDISLRYQKRFTKHFVPFEQEINLLRAIALAQQAHWYHAHRVLEQNGIRIGHYLGIQSLPCYYDVIPWIRRWITKIERENERLVSAHERSAKKGPPPKAKSRTAPKPAKERAPRKAEPEPASSALAVEPLALRAAAAPVSFTLPKPDEVLALRPTVNEDPVWFRLRYDFARLGLLEEYDELLCLPTLHGVEAHWYQIETARKVLKQFRGRVLLADEVGLGKTVEAGMILKEYLLRGMVERVLVLTPASLVGQWEEEMATKFDIPFATSYSSLVRTNPERFWSQPRVIASIATARRAEHLEVLARQSYDIVIVDEAHHVKNRSTNNWKLVDALHKRFLLLLSATPVQNNLVELYNLLTLLKPGIFKTEKEFRASYMTHGKPRVPANRDRMRDLMRDVMIRNTRALVDVRLPPRHAVTLRLDPDPEEAACYLELNRLATGLHEKEPTRHRLTLKSLLSTAGSSPFAAAAAVYRFAAATEPSPEWLDLCDRYAALTRSGKEEALLELLRRNPHEKKLVFVHHRETLARLADRLAAEGIPFALFEGSMSGPDKDRAIERFREDVPVLLSTESGGEGRNIQFCNTLVNFDLPWNPMQIEQRIGRLHRIGQTREVFVFNLTVRGTVEDYVLRILDEKINMFEMVVGEVGEILGEMDEGQDFAEMVFAAWVRTTEGDRDAAFEALGDQLVEARRQYESARSLDEELFGDEFVTG